MPSDVHQFLDARMALAQLVAKVLPLFQGRAMHSGHLTAE